MPEVNITGIDRFTIQARLLPVIVLILPLCLSITGLISSKELTTGILTGSVTGLALMAFMSQLGRDLGKQKEPKLYKMWGGMPSVTILKHSKTWLNEETLRRHHEKLQALTGKPLPSPDEENADMSSAEKRYAACSDLLKEKTRDKEKFPILKEELINYNFRRNLWGVKPVGIVFCIISILIPYVAFFTNQLWGITLTKFGVITSVINVCILVLWLLRITPSWVKQTANAYAERLITSCENIPVKEEIK